jgi:hypothetical protein
MTDFTQETKYKIAPRLKQEIDQEYTQCAMKAGDFEFKIQQLKAQVNGCYSRMRQLEKEATESVKIKTSPEDSL